MAKQIILIEHGVERDDNRVARHVRAAGYVADVRRPCAGDLLPNMSDAIAGAVFFGGRYNAFDVEKHPFLRDEYDFLARCLDADIPLLGICQGAQMIAWHLGAHVGPPASDVHEFGYYELMPAAGAEDFLPGPLHVAQSHWHGFDLPAGAIRLASSALYPNQAFRIGDKVFGLQCHAEVTPAGFRDMQRAGTTRYGLPGVQTRAEQDLLMARHDAAQSLWFNGFLAKLFPITV